MQAHAFWEFLLFFFSFFGAVASSSTYPCQWVGQWVIVSDLEIVIASPIFASLLGTPTWGENSESFPQYQLLSSPIYLNWGMYIWKYWLVLQLYQFIHHFLLFVIHLSTHIFHLRKKPGLHLRKVLFWSAFLLSWSAFFFLYPGRLFSSSILVGWPRKQETSTSPSFHSRSAKTVIAPVW